MSYPPPPADGAPDPYQSPPPPPPADPTLMYPPPPTSPAPTSGAGYPPPPGYGQPTSGAGYPPPAPGVPGYGQPTSGSGYTTPPGYPPSPGYAPPGADPFGGPAQYGQPAYGSPYGPPIMPTNTMAILALVFAFIFSPAAIVLGHIAKKQISRTGEQGSGLATAGLILGYIGLAILLAYCGVFVAAIAFSANSGVSTY